MNSRTKFAISPKTHRAVSRISFVGRRVHHFKRPTPKANPYDLVRYLYSLGKAQR